MASYRPDDGRGRWVEQLRQEMERHGFYAERPQHRAVAAPQSVLWRMCAVPFFAVMGDVCIPILEADWQFMSLTTRRVIGPVCWPPTCGTTA